MNTKILLVSMAAPPKNDPEALQTAKYIKYLSKKVDLHLLTSTETLWMPYDASLENYLENVRKIYLKKVFEPKYLSIFLNKFFNKNMLPDTRCTFHFFSDRVVNEIAKEKVSLIYSRSFPLSSTILALKIKKKLQLPWILHLSDPWVESPMFKYKKQKYHLRMEKEAFNLADIISFTSNHTLEIYRKKYPNLKDKFTVFPNAFDEDDTNFFQKEKSLLTNEKIEIVYTGSLNGSRTIKYLIDAISLIPNYREQINITIAGPIDSFNKEIIQSNEDVINYKGVIERTKCISLQSSADLLLAIDFYFELKEEATFFPSKLLDYFLTQKPILAITTRDSETERVLKNTQNYIFYHNQIDELAKWLKCIILDRKSLPNSKKLPKEYSVENNVNRLYKIINDLIDEK